MRLPADELIEAIDGYIDYFSHKRIKLKLKGLNHSNPSNSFASWVAEFASPNNPAGSGVTRTS